MSIENRLQKNYLLKKLTTIKIGGPAKVFVSVKSERELLEALEFGKKNKLKWYVVGEGSNIIPSDKGFAGLVIQNKIQKFERNGTAVTVGAGNNLLRLIFKLDKLGLSGLEKMAGIPGSVGGAVYGSAGAYGQEIQSKVVSVKVYDARSGKFKTLSKKQCRFSYRTSIFKKKKNLIITEINIRLRKGTGLIKVSKQIIRLREKKYKKGLKSQGSFFKNIKLDDLSKKQRETLLKKIESQGVKYGKIPSGYLLEQVGAKGTRQGSIAVADHHANLVYNLRGGKADDVVKLSKKLKEQVKKKFGIMIEEEVQYL